LADLGRGAAIENLVALWRRRYLHIGYHVSIAAECGDWPAIIDTTSCRVVHEALSNAVRHADAKIVASGHPTPSGPARFEQVADRRTPHREALLKLDQGAGKRSHASPKPQARLARRPRWHLPFTPAYGPGSTPAFAGAAGGS